MRNALTFLILLFVTAALAQQAPQYSQYMLNKYGFNPAYAGLDNSLSVTGVYRKQWVNLPGSPETQNLTAHMPLYILGGGIGINVENDNLGAERTTSAMISYNYWKPINKTSILSVGIGVGGAQKSLDGTKLRTPDGNYNPDTELIEHNDGRLPGTLITTNVPILNAGIYFQSPQMGIGISANNINEPTAKLEFEGNSTNFDFNRNYFFIFAYNFELGSSFVVYPSLFAKSDLYEHQVEFSTIIKYNDNIFGGASFRGYDSSSIDAIVFIAGFKLNEKVTFAYSYDMTLSELQNVSKGSHEISLNYNLNKSIGAGIPPNIIYNPRFL